MYAAISCGVAASVVFAAGWGGVSIPLFVATVCWGLVLISTGTRRTSPSLIVLVLIVSLVWVFRSSMWVLVPAAFTIALMLPGINLLGSNSLLDMPWGRLGGFAPQLLKAVGQGVTWLTRGAANVIPTPGRTRALSLIRAVVVAAPIVAVLVLLLASADPLFAAVLQPDISPTAIVVRGSLFFAGVLLFAILAVLTDGRDDAEAEPKWVPIGRLESLMVLVGVATVLAAFVLVQVGASFGMGTNTLNSRGIAVADYARSGYFQLLAVVLLTTVILVSIDGLRRTGTRRRHAERALSCFIVVMALVMMVEALQRLALYVDAFGLTMLRLVCLPGALWMTTLLVLVGFWVTRNRRRHHWLPGAALLSFLAVLGGFAAVNPESLVVHFNANRPAESALDLDYLSSLSDDAVPALVDVLPQLTVEQSAQLRYMLCQRSPTGDVWSTWSLSSARADRELAALCGADE